MQGAIVAGGELVIHLLDSWQAAGATLEELCNLCNKEVVPLKFQCKCGKTWGYMTNMGDLQFEVNCLACGSPVDITYDLKHDEYVNV